MWKLIIENRFKYWSKISRIPSNIHSNIYIIGDNIVIKCFRKSLCLLQEQMEHHAVRTPNKDDQSIRCVVSGHCRVYTSRF